MSTTIPIFKFKQDGGSKVMGLNIRLMVWQGIWSDDPMDDLENDLQYLCCPNLARLLMKHRYFRLIRRGLSFTNSWTLIISLIFQLVFILPTGLYVHRNSKMDMIYNLTVYIIKGIVLVVILNIKLYCASYKNILVECEKVFGPDHLDNDEQKGMLKKTHVLCHSIAKYLQLIVGSVVAVAILVSAIGFFLPKRELFPREIYPWDTHGSPGYEITLTLVTSQYILLYSTSVTLASFFFSNLYYLVTYFDILINKIENLRKTAIARVEVKESLDLEMADSNENENYVVQKSISSARVLRMELDELNPGLEAIRKSSSELYWKEITRALPRKVLISGEDIVSPHSGLKKPDSCLKDAEEVKLKKAKRRLDEKVYEEMLVLIDEAIVCHAQLLSSTQKFGSLASVVFGWLFIVNTVTLALVVIVVTLATEITPWEIVIVVSSIKLTLIYLMVNLMADKITEKSLAVGEACYNCDWTGASPCFKKSLLIIMTRANVPVEYKPDGLDPLSLSNFAAVSKIAYKMISTMFSFVK